MRGCWELGGTLTMETGRPITVVSGRDNSLSGVNFDRPDVNGSPQLPTDRSRGELIDRYFRTEVFSANLPGRYGNAGRGILSSQGAFGWDISTSKSFRIKESHSLPAGMPST
jgi:hypothetical protein